MVFVIISVARGRHMYPGRNSNCGLRRKPAICSVPVVQVHLPVSHRKTFLSPGTVCRLRESIAGSVRLALIGTGVLPPEAHAGLFADIEIAIGLIVETVVSKLEDDSKSPICAVFAVRQWVKVSW